MAKKKTHAAGLLDTIVKMAVGGGKIDDKLPVYRPNTGSHSQGGSRQWKKPPKTRSR